MLEHLMQMVPMLALAGLMTGWMTETLSRGGYGLIPDMVLGLGGSMLLGATIWLVISAATGMLGMFLIGSAGAALAIGAQRGLWRPARIGP